MRRSAAGRISHIFPARFARRNASFSFVFPAFGLQIPKIFPARFARRFASFSFVFLAFGAQLASSGRARAWLGPPRSPGDIVRLPEGGGPPRQTPPPSPLPPDTAAQTPPPSSPQYLWTLPHQPCGAPNIRIPRRASRAELHLSPLFPCLWSSTTSFPRDGGGIILGG